MKLSISDPQVGELNNMHFRLIKFSKSILPGKLKSPLAPSVSRKLQI